MKQFHMISVLICIFPFSTTPGYSAPAVQSGSLIADAYLPSHSKTDQPQNSIGFVSYVYEPAPNHILVEILIRTQGQGMDIESDTGNETATFDTGGIRFASNSSSEIMDTTTAPDDHLIEKRVKGSIRSHRKNVYRAKL